MIWEEIGQAAAGSLSRAPIFGGWLVKYVDDVRSEFDSGYVGQPDFREGYEWKTSITFVPDPEHKWYLSIEYPIKP